ncbi:MAG: NAD(P)/FAD-dependent oxidoreductase [Candidatus Andersenbacteria bacterium]|nr:NAD(P)/FAD-dependent oxidoreductase [Candidatus Andersenbacteria bacterium]MBI3250377.1 NAD(P)/FAD-dependent oxidoreductase [Candidatus Andersenbacteria bacterium]
MKRILILGGGFAGVETFRRLHKQLHPAGKHNVELQLINRTNYFTFSPMLHEVATGAVTREQVVQPLREILACCGKDFHQASVKQVDLARNVVVTDSGEHPYDILVVTLGVEQGFFGVAGAAENALALKWLPGALNIRNRIINSFEKASEMQDRHDTAGVRRFLRFLIIGGGATGTELAGQISDLVVHEMRSFYGDVPQSLCSLELIHAGQRLLEVLSPTASIKVQRRLENLGVDVRLNARVVEVGKDFVKLATGEKVESNNIFWTAGTESTLPGILPKEVLTERGLAMIEPTFQLTGHEHVFVLGDCAQIQDKAYAFPPTAQAAVQAARITAKNILAQLNEKPLVKKKYKTKGDIIPIGNWWGLYEKKFLRVTGVGSWILRRIVFLKTMYGWTNRIEVAFTWLVALVLPRDTSEF